MSTTQHGHTAGATQAQANPFFFNPFAFHPAAFAPMFDPASVVSAWMQEAQAGMRRAMATPKVIEAATRVTKGCTPYDVVMTEGPVRLLRYKGKADKKHATPVLFVFALVNRPYVLDILPHKSVIRQYLNHGFDVFMIDWGIPEPQDKSKTLSDYVEGNMQGMVRRVLQETGQPSLNLVGYCMGGTMSAMFTSRHQELVKTLTLMAAPLSWGPACKSLLMTWTDAESFNVDALVDQVGMIPPQFLGSSFAMMKPVANFFQKWVGFAEKMEDEKFLEEFFAMETWSNDNIPISGEVYRDFVKFGFQQDRLVKGTFPLGGKPVNLGNITCPILTITADKDHLVLPEQSFPVEEAVSSTDVTRMAVGGGHIGLAVGSKAHRELWPHACAWAAQRSDPAK